MDAVEVHAEPAGGAQAPAVGAIAAPAEEVGNGVVAADILDDGLPARRRVRARTVLVCAGVFVAALVSAAVLIGLALSREIPAWWRSVDAADPRVIQTATDVENGIATLLYQARPGTSIGQAIGAEPGKSWKVGLKASEANAWLNARLPKWLANQDESFVWPEEVRELQVDFRDQRIHVGARLAPVAGGRDRVVSATIAPEFRDDGSLWMPAEWVTLGRLSVPASWLLPEELGSGAAPIPDDLRELPQTQGILGAFSGKHAALGNPTIRLGDGRRVRLLGLEVKDGRIEIECRTEQK